MGILDFIPGGFIIAGVINSIINSPFIYGLGNKAKDFLANKIRAEGGKQILLSIVEGYRDSISLIRVLGNRKDWSRKIQILNS